MRDSLVDRPIVDPTAAAADPPHITVARNKPLGGDPAIRCRAERHQDVDKRESQRSDWIHFRATEIPRQRSWREHVTLCFFLLSLCEL